MYKRRARATRVQSKTSGLKVRHPLATPTPLHGAKEGRQPLQSHAPLTVGVAVQTFVSAYKQGPSSVDASGEKALSVGANEWRHLGNRQHCLRRDCGAALLSRVSNLRCACGEKNSVRAHQQSQWGQRDPSRKKHGGCRRAIRRLHG